jgi:excisionase family DNA binding protein
MMQRARRTDAVARDAARPASLADAPDFLTVVELAQLLRIGRNQAYALVNSGRVVSCRFGGSIRIPRTAIEQLLNTPPVPAGGGS